MKIHVKEHQKEQVIERNVSNEAEDVKKLTTGYSHIDFSYDKSLIAKIVRNNKLF